jgi:ABC-type polysaccharide/polyol phosphate transport system ATPase subunit
LIIDEVLAVVGDAEFQKKAIGKDAGYFTKGRVLFC